ncbi:MAG: hypothetical protein FJ290_07245 [Planctomycetes bacterium]|nr:hypothetical protein [Planctomycetota bacterium]
MLEKFGFEDRAGQVKVHRDAQTFERQCRSRGLNTHIAGPFYDVKEGCPGHYQIHTGRPPFLPGPVSLDGEILRISPFEARGRRAYIAGPFPSSQPCAGWWDVYEDLGRAPDKPDEPAPEPEKPEEPPPEKAAPPQPEAKPEAGALPAQVYVTVARVNLFEKPQAGSGAAGTAAKGAALRVWAEEGVWYFVSLPDGTTGWVPKAFTTPTAPQP